MKRFNVGDYAVCPGHGVGQIVDIESRSVGDKESQFFIIKIMANGMTVMVPVESVNGIRAIVGDPEIQDVYRLLSDHEVKIDTSTWNRRYRDYMTKIKTGSLVEIADVLRQLFLLKHKKTLSFGEKKMLDQCKGLIAQEISISMGNEIKQVESKIDSCFQ
jgi:CarD family transcriptional regulator